MLTPNNAAPTHIMVPVHIYGAVMNLLYKRPYIEVAELIAALSQSQSIRAGGLDEPPGAPVQSSAESAVPSIPSGEQHENGQRSDPQST